MYQPLREKKIVKQISFFEQIQGEKGFKKKKTFSNKETVYALYIARLLPAQGRAGLRDKIAATRPIGF